MALCHGQGAHAHGVRVHLRGYEYDLPDRSRVYGSEHVHEGVHDRVSGCALENERDLHDYVRGYGRENADPNENAHVDEVLPCATS